MAKILITGGAGFIPSDMALRLATNASDTIVLVDNLITGSMENVPLSEFDNIRFIKADVNDFNDISSVFYAWHFDYVFHYAALVGVQRTLANPTKVLQDIEGIKNILNLSKNTGVKRVFYSSSSEVYGEPVQIPQNEHTTPLNSRLPYAIVKNVGEAFLRSYQADFGLDYTIFRFFNTYGISQSQDFVIAKYISAALENSDIFIYGDGKQTRTFCYIDDNTESCEIIFKQNLHINDVINIGSDIETTVLELAQKIIQITNSKSQIKFLPPLQEGDMSRRKPDIEKMKKLLNRDLISLEDGLTKIISKKK